MPQRECLSDGTFYSCSTFFSQLYTLHAKVNGNVFPLVFGLLPNKTQDTYVCFFELLKNAVHERQSVLTPEHWMLDFEVAAHNAVRTSFPQTSVKGCCFHYTQCIWRKVQSSGLVVMFKEDDEFRRLVRRAAVLPLVPENSVEDVWFQALEDNQDDSPPVMRFKDYGPRPGWKAISNIGTTTTTTGQEQRMQLRDGTIN